MAIRVTAFRTSIRLVSEGGRLALTVNGRTIRGEAELRAFRGIRIEAFNSAFPMGGETLTLGSRGRILMRDRLPRRFSSTPDRLAPLGDWYIDESAGGGVVYERAIEIPPDFVLTATFTGRCLHYTSVVLEGEPFVSAQFRRGLLNNDLVLSVGDRMVGSDALVSPLPQMALNALDLALRGLVAACILILVFATGRILLLRSGDKPFVASLRRAWSGASRNWPALVAGALALIALAIRLWTSREVLEGLAHTPDEVAYILQSKWIVSNRIYQMASQIQDYLTVPFTFVRDGKWFGMYPIGWPLLLAIGQIVSLPWAIGPILGAAYVLLVFLIGKELYGEIVGLGAAILAAFSPMAILMSSSYLSHGPAALMLAIFLWLFLLARRRNSPWLCALSGASLGFAFAIRPVTTLALALPFAFVLFREFTTSDRKSDF
ncbi:MAG TPA: glycosyltransferase family 39 protein, partial [Thermoanaerobaculia bacterium]|nr:glycosyltransferase family 39 protein [Thermoanaerobaculia bacterium]